MSEKIQRELQQQRDRWLELNDYCFNILQNIMNGKVQQVWLSYAKSERPKDLPDRHSLDKTIRDETAKLAKQLPELSRIIQKMKQLCEMLPLSYTQQYQLELTCQYEGELRAKLQIIKQINEPTLTINHASLETTAMVILSIWKHQPSIRQR